MTKRLFGGILLLIVLGWNSYMGYRVVAHLGGLALSLWLPSLVLVGASSYVGIRLVLGRRSRNETETSDYQSGYRVGRGLGTLKAILKALGWDTWGEPTSAWQRGMIAGYESRGKQPKESTHD